MRKKPRTLTFDVRLKVVDWLRANKSSLETMTIRETTFRIIQELRVQVTHSQVRKLTDASGLEVKFKRERRATKNLSAADSLRRDSLISQAILQLISFLPDDDAADLYPGLASIVSYDRSRKLDQHQKEVTAIEKMTPDERLEMYKRFTGAGVLVVPDIDSETLPLDPEV